MSPILSSGATISTLTIGSGVIMSADMGTFRVDVEIENPARAGSGRLKAKMSSILQPHRA